jgi:hypothetical protein
VALMCPHVPGATLGTEDAALTADPLVVRTYAKRQISKRRAMPEGILAKGERRQQPR